MTDALSIIYLARHGQTAWSLTGQHTGLTDLPLTERGERNARRLGARLSGLEFAKVFSSPLKRAWPTCELAGFGAAAVVDPDLVEWDYGAYEGVTTAEVRKSAPTGSCSGTDAPTARPRNRWACAPIASSREPARWTAMSSSSRAATSSACSLHAGSVSTHRLPADIFCSARPASVRLATSTTSHVP